MIRWCSFCQRYLGEAEPFDDYSLTHGICKPCAASFAADRDFGQATHLVDFFRRLNVAGQGGTTMSAAAVLDEGIALGLRPIDLLMGLIQPALYHVGERWAAGDISVVDEHGFTAMASALVALVTEKYPEAQAYRQAPAPRVLLVSADGNYHTLGIQLVELILILERIPTFTVYPGVGSEEVVQLCRKVRPPVIGFSIAMPAQLDGVRKAVEAIARDASGPPRFILGGFPIRCGLRTADEPRIEAIAHPLALVETLRKG